jgi:hypothetical protein
MTKMRQQVQVARRREAREDVDSIFEMLIPLISIRKHNETGSAYKKIALKGKADRHRKSSSTKNYHDFGLYPSPCVV